MSTSKSAIAALVAVTVMAGSSSANNGAPIVFDQLTGSDALFLSDFYNTFSPDGDRLADSFELTSKTSITGSSHLGIYFFVTAATVGGITDSFTIRIMGNDLGVDGIVSDDDLPNNVVVASVTDVIPTSRTATGRNRYYSDEFLYELDYASTPMVLDPGKYWLDIFNTDPSLNDWSCSQGVVGVPGSVEGRARRQSTSTWVLDTIPGYAIVDPNHTGFRLCGFPVPPTIYCTAKTSSAGCVTSILTSFGQPVSGDSNYLVGANSVQGQKAGILFGGNSGPASTPFSGGTLCVQPPLRRSAIQFSGGTGQNTCDGSYFLTVNDGSVFPAGLDAGPGNSGWYQFWYRDPNNGAGTLGTALSNAVELCFQP